jgi:hypothetical protein
MMTYDPRDWYWIVGNDDSKYWSSKSSSYVTEKPKDHGVTKIDTEANLAEVLAVYGLKGPVSVVPASVPMWAVRTILQQDGLFDQADALIKNSNDAALKNVWDYGNYADRDSFSIAALGNSLGLTEAQIDKMFIDAANIKP